MTLLQAGILAQLARGTQNALNLAVALDTRIPDIACELNKLSAAGVVEHVEDGWRLTDKVAA